MDTPTPPLSEDAAVRRAAAMRFLDTRVDYEKFRRMAYPTWAGRLELVSALLSRLGNPERGVHAIHIAGTKGKGSTAAMIGAILRSAGYKTGEYFSPHLSNLEERIVVDGRPCSAEELADLALAVEPAVLAIDQTLAAQPPGLGLTYFEVVTAMALLHFARCKVQAAVLEVGLGGRLDATNVCLPRVSVITSISFDHTHELGDRLDLIAREKAGIIKPEIPVISGVTDPPARDVVRDVCHRAACRLTELGSDFEFDYWPPRDLQAAFMPGRMDFRWRDAQRGPALEHLLVPLPGRHQAANAALAVAAAAELRHAGYDIPEQAVRKGLAAVRLAGRIEVLARRPTVVLDTAHNVASIEALLRVLDESFAARRKWLIFAASGDKDIPGMLRCALPRFDEVVFTRYRPSPRAASPEMLAALAGQLTGRRYPVCPTPAEAWTLVSSQARPEDLICITGSFFLAGELRVGLCEGRLPLAAQEVLCAGDRRSLP